MKRDFRSEIAKNVRFYRQGTVRQIRKVSPEASKVLLQLISKTRDNVSRLRQIAKEQIQHRDNNNPCQGTVAEKEDNLQKLSKESHSNNSERKPIAVVPSETDRSTAVVDTTDTAKKTALHAIIEADEKCSFSDESQATLSSACGDSENDKQVIEAHNNVESAQPIDAGENLWNDIRRALLDINDKVNNLTKEKSDLDVALLDQVDQVLDRFEEARIDQLVIRLFLIAKYLRKWKNEGSAIGDKDTVETSSDENGIDISLRMKKQSDINSAYKNTIRAIEEMEQFGVSTIIPTIGDPFDPMTMEAYCQHSLEGNVFVSKVLEFGYKKAELESDKPVVKKRALVMIEEKSGPTENRS